ncbi:MAG: hypothetical protein G01um101472_430 [Parcubacteria group bacterium Gr01-1014_72]|nr:MAG: hypothetical protein G01um101472_430 [Parcubacteria group bacterium Gr01-1014_72]
MEEETNKNIADASQNTPQEPVLGQNKKEIPRLPIIIFAVVVIIAVAVYFVYSNKSKISAPVTSTSTSNSNIEGQQQKPIAQTNIGSPVDHATYLQIQGLMQKTQFSKPEVIENSLRFFDIDGDGYLDALGFLKLTFSYDSNYLFSTWHRNGAEFVYYPDDYYDFRLSEKYHGGLPCSIYDLTIGSITLACTKSGQEYLTTLRYQKNGVGYYRDVDAHVITFENNANWPEYISKKGGMQFDYPSDVQISEKTYQIYDDLITIITAKRNTQVLFEIKTVPEQPNQGGGTITLAQKTVFLKLSDGSYISRNWMGDSASQEAGVFYERANAYRRNNAGNIGESNDQTNVNKNRGYVLFTPLTSENNLKEIDNIFASIKYTEIPAVKDVDTIVLQNHSVSLSNIVTLQVPGHVIERQPAEKNPVAVAEKDLEITFINSPIYQPSSLNLELLPFGSVGGTNAIGGGGYDVDKNGCYNYEKDNITAPQKVGVNQVCRFGYGDGGISVQGYYVLDPSRKYILSITQDNSFSDFNFEILSPDLKDVVESVRFTNQ